MNRMRLMPNRVGIILACVLVFSTLFTAAVPEKVHATARAATIVSHSIPSTMKAGTSYTVSVTVRNEGTAAWTGEAGFGLGAVGDSDPFSSTTRQAITGQTVEPGGTLTFTFTLTAPSKTGAYVTDWQMLQEYVEWFGSTVSVNVNVVSTVTGHAAAIVSDNIPAVMAKGHTYPVTITVRNDGTDTWSEAALFRLGGVDDSDPFTDTRQNIPANQTVGLGQTYSFTFLMKAPDTVGTYTTDWRMVQDGVAWFGTTLIKNVQVTDGTRNATMISHTIPAVMEIGQTYNVSVTIKNTGNTSWYEDSTSVGKYRLGGVGDSDPFTTARVLMPSADMVKPGEHYTFNFQMKAPSVPGMYVSDWRMVQEYVTWFGEVLTQTVTVIDASITQPTFAAGTGTGLKGEYYSNMNLTGLQLTRTDHNVNFNWGTSSPGTSIPVDQFSVRWTGSVQPLYSESYTFDVVSDDGVRLWVDGKLLIDSWLIQAGERVGTPIALKAGQKYDIRIEYFENTGGTAAYLYWSSSSQAKQIVPQTQLYPPTQASGTGLKGEYYSNKDLTGLQLSRLDGTVNFDWGEGSPVNSIPVDHFSVRWTGTILPLYNETYTFNVVSDDGVRLWVDGKLLIDSWVIQAGERVGTPIALKAGQRYDIRIEYFENTGGTAAYLYWSSASQAKQIVPTTQLYPPLEADGVGLRGEYYDNMDLTNLKLTRTDSDVDFNWSSGSPDASIGADTFSARWTGTIKPKYSEDYTFYLTADDGVRLWVDGKLLLNSWINQAGQFTSNSIKLEAGYSYDIEIEYFENLSGATVGLYWSSASQTKQIVPQSQLNPPAELAGVGLKAQYYNNMNLSGEPPVTRTDATINFNWSSNAPVWPIPADQFSVRWTGTIQPKYSENYTFYAGVDDGVRLWVNDQLILDRWQGQSDEFASSVIALKAGYRYSIRMEYFEGAGNAVAMLSWSSSSQPKQIVPQSQLFLPYLTYSPQAYHYDANGRLDYVRLSDGTVVRYYYDANGNLLKTSRE